MNYVILSDQSVREKLGLGRRSRRPYNSIVRVLQSSRTTSSSKSPKSSIRSPINWSTFAWQRQSRVYSPCMQPWGNGKLHLTQAFLVRKSILWYELLEYVFRKPIPQGSPSWPLTKLFVFQRRYQSWVPCYLSYGRPIFSFLQDWLKLESRS